jgi:hypothetical protein
MPTLVNRLAIGYQNLASGKVISATTQEVGYLSSNLSNSRLAGPLGRWRSTDLSLTNQDIDIDLAAVEDFDVIALIGTNLEDDATRRIYTDDASNFASPDHDSNNEDDGDVFDLTTSPIIDGRDGWPVVGRHLVYFPGMTLSNRYVRVRLSDAGNADNYLRASVAWVSKILQLPFDFEWEAGPYMVDGEPGMERVLRTHQFISKGITTAQKVLLESLFYILKRSGRCLIIPRPLQKETWQHESLYGTFKDAPRSTRMLSSDELWQVTFGFVEVLD